MDAISAFRKEFQEKSDHTLEQLKTVQADIKNIVAEVSSLKTDIGNIKLQSENTRKTVENMETEQGRLSREIVLLKQEVADLQQHTRKNNILISGVPLTVKENVYVVLERIASILNVDYQRHAISVAHRLPSGNSGDKRPPSIIVNFISRTVKQEWLAARRVRRSLSAQEIHASFPDAPIYLNEHLTVQTRELFNGARRLMREEKLASVWTSDGRVMAKRDPTAPPFRVRDLRHLRDLGLKKEDDSSAP